MTAIAAQDAQRIKVGKKQFEVSQRLERVRARYRELTLLEEQVVKGIERGNLYNIRQRIGKARREMRPLEDRLAVMDGSAIRR